MHPTRRLQFGKWPAGTAAPCRVDRGAVPVCMKERPSSSKYLLALAVSALGVVYGDIGTSPLYAIRECFYGKHAIAATHENVLGVLSLIFWSLIAIISVKYLTFVMR